MNDTGHMTLDQAGALAAILGATERKLFVAYLDGGTVTSGRARYIGGHPVQPHGFPPRERNFAAEISADVRDLYLVVKLTPEPGVNAIRDTYRGWLVRNLIPAYRLGTFVTDFSPAAFEAGGGQAAVTAQECAACGSGTGPDRQGRWETGENDLDTWYACARCGVLLCDDCDLAEAGHDCGS